MTIKGIDVPDGMVRDWFFSNPLAVSQTIDGALREVVVLDLYIRNRGAAAITLRMEGQGLITIDPGDVFTLNDTELGLIVVTSTVTYDFLLTGVTYEKLKRRGLM